MKLKKSSRDVPELNMAAMPDLIFTVLFFFMIVTHMRENTVQVTYREPAGTSLKKVHNSLAVIDIYVGKDGKKDEYRVQVNNKVVPIETLEKVLNDERKKIPSDQMEYVCASLKADVNAPMSIIMQVKHALREAHILKINYSGIEKTS